MNELALFAGAGGGLLASRMLGWKTVCAVEIDHYCQAALLARQSDGHLEHFPIWDNVQTFQGEPWRGVVDLISAGFPCQPFSTAGRQEGEKDERNMWPETIRIIRKVGPEWVMLENVPGLLTQLDRNGRFYFGRILGDLAEAGYDAEWGVFSAFDCGAPHLRERLWIVGHAKCGGFRREPWRGPRSIAEIGHFGVEARNDADTKGGREGEIPAGQRDQGQRAADADRVCGPLPDAGSLQHESGGNEIRRPRAEDLLSHPESVGAQRGVFQPRRGTELGDDGDARPLADPKELAEREPPNEADPLSVGREARKELGGGRELSNPVGDGFGGVLREGGQGEEEPKERKNPDREGVGGGGDGALGPNSPDADGPGQPEFEGVGANAGSPRGDEFNPNDWWAVEPRLGRVAHGVAHRVDRLKAIGNGQVPDTAILAWVVLSEPFLK